MINVHLPKLPGGNLLHVAHAMGEHRDGKKIDIQFVSCLYQTRYPIGSISSSSAEYHYIEIVIMISIKIDFKAEATIEIGPIRFWEPCVSFFALSL